MADYYLPQIVFTGQETAARREAEQLQVSQSRSTETVEVTAASWEADRLRRTSRARVSADLDPRGFGSLIQKR